MINAKELFDLTEKAFKEFNTPRKTHFGLITETAGFNVDIATTKYVVRIIKGKGKNFYIVSIYSRNEKLLALINVHDNDSGFERHRSKWFGVYIQCLYTFGLIRLY